MKIIKMKRPLILGLMAAVLLGGAFYAAAQYRQKRALQAAEAANTLQAYAAYLQMYPSGRFNARAKTLLDTRHRQLKQEQLYKDSLDHLDLIYLSSSDLSSAPSGAEFIFNLFQIQMIVGSGVADPQLKEKLNELYDVLKPAYDANKEFLRRLDNMSAGQRESALTEYVRKYPRESVKPLLEPVRGLVTAEQERLKATMQELNDYEQAQQAVPR